MSSRRCPRMTLRRWVLLFGVITVAVVACAGVATQRAVARRTAAEQVLLRTVEPARETLEEYEHDVLALDVLVDNREVHSGPQLQAAARAVQEQGGRLDEELAGMQPAEAQDEQLDAIIEDWLQVSQFAADPDRAAPDDRRRFDDAETAFARLRATLTADYQAQQAHLQAAFQSVMTLMVVDFVAALLGVVALTGFALACLDRPLRRLTEDVTAVAGGDPRPLRHGRLPELGALAGATDAMRTQVADASAHAAAAEARRRVGFQIHDEVVQGLVAAQMALELDESDTASALLAEATTKARETVRTLLPADGLRPGALVRDREAGLSTDVELPRVVVPHSGE